jgi:mannose-1-phosphate guanylyltransferase
VLVGIEPTRPDTAYGYLRLGRTPARGGALRVERFVEKPDPARARRFLARGGHLWNAGMVVARPELLLAETQALAPEVWDALGPALERIASGRRVARAALERAYRRVRPLSFDYAVLERSTRVVAVRGRFAWSDLGSWDAVAAHLRADGDGNRLHCAAPPVVLDAQRNLVWSSTDRMIAVLGVRDLAVIQTTDSTLVCAIDRAQDVRRVVDELARRGREDLL